MFSGKVKRLVVGLSIVGAVCVSGIAVGEEPSWLDDVIRSWDRSIEENPSDADAYWQRGKAKFQAKQYAEAIRDYDRAIEVDSKKGPRCSIGLEAMMTGACPKVFQHRGDAKFALSKFSEAIKDYDKAIAVSVPGWEMGPDGLVDAYLPRGKAKFVLGQYAESLSDVNKAIELDPSNEDALQFQLQAKKALNLGPEAPEASPKSNAGLRSRVVRSESEGAEPATAQEYWARGLRKRTKNQLQEAIRDFDMALKLDPQLVGVYFTRGFTKFAFKKYFEAIKDFDKAIELEDPQTAADAYEFRGNAKDALGHKGEGDADRAIAEKLRGN